MTELEVLVETRFTTTITGPEQVSELCSITVHCRVAGDPANTTLLVRLADNGAGTNGLNRRSG